MRLVLLFLSISVALFSNDWNVKPKVSSRIGFDSNMLRQTKREIGFLNFKIAPGVLINNKNNESNSISLMADVGYILNIGINDSSTYNKNVRENSNWIASLGVDMSFWERGHFSPFISDDLKKMSYYSYSSDVEKFDNILSLGFDTTPFGRALKFRLEYDFNFHKTIFEGDLAKNTKLAAEAQDNLGHDILFYTNWAFLPKTVFLFSFKYAWLFHPNSKFEAFDSRTMEGFIGLKGVITPKLSTTLKFGWNYTTFDSNVGSFNGFVTNIALAYYFSDKNNIKFSYDKNIKDVIFSNYLSYHALSFVWNSKIKNNFSFQLLTRTMLYFFEGFGADAPNYTNSSSNRFDLLFSVSPSLSYRYKQVQFNLKYIIDKNFTEFYTTFKGSEKINYDYIKHQLFLDFVYSF